MDKNLQRGGGRRPSSQPVRVDEREKGEVLSSRRARGAHGRRAHTPACTHIHRRDAVTPIGGAKLLGSTCWMAEVFLLLQHLRCNYILLIANVIVPYSQPAQFMMYSYKLHKFMFFKGGACRSKRNMRS